MASKKKPQQTPPLERTQPRPYREVVEERRRAKAAAGPKSEPLPQGEFLPEPVEDEE